jgi:hypothetical protein
LAGLGSTGDKPQPPSAKKPVSAKPLQSVSIKSFTKKTGEAAPARAEDEKQDNYSTPRGDQIDPSWANSFTPDELQKVWNNYARLVEKSNPRLFSMLTARSPRLKGERMVVFPLQNETQEVELMQAKSSMFNYLRRELKHAKLQLEVEYVREEGGPRKAYTAADKYKVLAEKNPILDKLKNALNLDLE